MPEPRKHESSRKRESVFVLSLYFVLSCFMMWPLAAGLARDVPGDLGDSLLNMWILGWGAEAVPHVVTGQMPLGDVWNGNIFYPEPLVLSYSEHLFGQVLQILPVYYLTGNLILCYNLLFLSTFAVSGLGTYLLVRDITGDRYAAFFAGLVFAFVPYRAAQISHLQTLSSQWMPLALYGFRRYITAGRVKALAGGAAALLMQNWSCGYFLIYFTPLAILFVVHQIAAAGRLRDVRMWLAFAAAALVVAAGTWPFLALYLEAQRLRAFARPLSEILGYSADVYSYLTAAEPLRVAGPLVNAWPRSEGELFLGFVPWALAFMAIYASVGEARAEARGDATLFKEATRSRRISLRAFATWIAGVVAAVMTGAFVAILFTGRVVTSIAGVPIRATNAPRVLGQLAIAIAALILLSGKFRRVAGHMLASSTGLGLVSLLLCVWLSLGPVVHSRGEVLDGIGLYGVLLNYVPGFAGLRVPARYAMIAALYLSILAGIGAAWLMRPTIAGRRARTILVALSIVFLVEALMAPLPVNQTWAEGSILPPTRIEPRASAPAVYRQLSTMPKGTVVAEFPFGDAGWELRYVYYSTVHWKPILNGYSGGFPSRYVTAVARLRHIADAPDAAWAVLTDASTTHVVVHESGLTSGDVAVITSWLQSHGAREIARFGSDVLYALPYAR